LCVQVVFPPIPKGPEASAAAELQGIIRGSLRSRESKRLEAADVQDQLFQMMRRNGWVH